MIEQFKRDVNEGLSAKHKFLPSKYFYDARGSQLFVEIMNAPEYYLTNAEHNILRNQTTTIINSFGMQERFFELVELGAGDGTKTLELLRALDGSYDFNFMPIDISVDALSLLEKRLKQEVPNVTVKPQHGMYFSVLEDIKKINHPKVILFLGSNLGNMLDDAAHDFMSKLSHAMNAGDMLFLGVDLKKSKDIILPAYNDAAGITKDFNLNLLNRINRELDANFNLNAFTHQPVYDEQRGVAYSYLQSTAQQEVCIGALNKTFYFTQGERIHTEISRKYDDETVAKVIANTGLQIEHKFTDSQNYFADYLLIKST